MNEPLDYSRSSSNLPTECAEHCRICSHRKWYMSKGQVCAITEDKPRFDGLCPDLVLSRAARNWDADAHLNRLDRTEAHVTAAGPLIIGGSVGLAIFIVFLWIALNARTEFVQYVGFGISCLGVLVILFGVFMHIGHRLNWTHREQDHATIVSLLEAYSDR